MCAIVGGALLRHIGTPGIASSDCVGEQSGYHCPPDAVLIAMPDFKPLQKAMVVIAVSNYDAPYEPLPGTLTSARRIANWAKSPGVGRGYKVLEINDAPAGAQPGKPVTAERLRK